MAQKLVGKSAVVTGSGNGIGRGVALMFAAEGAKVVVNDIAKDPDGMRAADRVVREITAAGGTAVANYDSVTARVGGENIIKTATSNFGRIDILVNCAGNFKPCPTVKVTEDDWDSIIDVHLKGHFNCTKAAVIEMTQQKSGRIINFSSRAAFAGAGALVYSTAKAGILGFTTSLAAELKEHGITVNAILPSATTNLFPGTAPRGGDVPDSLSLDPDYIAPIIAYLATDEAQSITGQFIYASGGDICIYARPLQPRTFIRKIGKWTVDELIGVIPPLRVG
jgi:3-oxoacyl-[acyl-carrier protein] reductase